MSANVMTKTKRKRMPTLRVVFILSCIVLPVLNWLVFYVYVNLSSIGMAFTDSAGNLSLANFERVFTELAAPTSKLREAFRNTFITFGVTVALFPFKILVSYFLYKKVPFHNFIRQAFFLPMILSGIVLTMVFQELVGVNGFIAEWVGKIAGLDYNPELLADSRYANIVIIVHMIWLTFPGDLIIWGGAFARIPEEVLEAGRIDGVNWWQEFTRLIIPLMWPTFSLSAILLLCGVFSSSGEVFLLTQGNYGTVTVSAWMQLELYGNSGSAYVTNAYNYMSAFGVVITILASTISLTVRKFTDKVFANVEY